MRWLLFLARLTFICNLFFICCVVFRYKDIIEDQLLKGLVIVLGWLIAPLLTVTLTVLLLAIYFKRKVTSAQIPAWLIIFNVLMQIAQIIIIPL
jgi:hypothetical protein